MENESNPQITLWPITWVRGYVSPFSFCKKPCPRPCHVRGGTICTFNIRKANGSGSWLVRRFEIELWLWGSSYLVVVGVEFDELRDRSIDHCAHGHHKSVLLGFLAWLGFWRWLCVSHMCMCAYVHVECSLRVVIRPSFCGVTYIGLHFVLQNS